MSAEARSEFRDGISRQTEADTARMLTQTLSADVPNLLSPSLEPDEFIALNLTDIEKVLGGMDAAFETTIDQLPKQPSGQNRDHGLRLWITNIKDF